MRNINTSFAKNARSFFVIEASNVMRAVSDLATYLLRLIKSQVYGYSQHLVPGKFRHPALQPGTFGGPTVTVQGRQITAMPSSQLDNGERGNLRWDCRLSLNQV